MTRASLLFGGLLVLAVIPLFVQDSYTRHLFILAFIYAVIASNWDLSLGYAGLFNFGHLVFFATGVYTVAIAAKTLGISPWLAIPMSGVTAAIAGLIVSAPVAAEGDLCSIGDICLRAACIAADPEPVASHRRGRGHGEDPLSADR